MARDNKAVTAAEDQLPAELLGAMSGIDEGMENADADAFAIPFLALLQSGSPQVKKGNPAQIEGAQEGMIFNTVSGEVFDGDDGILVVPVYYRRGIVEWIPRDEGGGYVEEHVPGEEPASRRSEQTGRDTMDNGHELVDTRYHYCLLVKTDDKGAPVDYEPVVIAMASTGVKVSKKWMFNIQGKKLPNGKSALMRAQIWRLSTIIETKDEYTWVNWKASFERFVPTKELFDAASEFLKGIKSGDMKENTEQMRAAEGEAQTSEPNADPMFGPDEEF